MRLSIIAISILSFLLSVPALNGQETMTEPQQVATPVPIQAVVFLGPINSRISFVGVHVGDDPKPRLGGFSQFQGYAVVDPAKNTVESLVYDIDVDSVWTQFEKLTGHLKAADFFDTQNFPTARFASTKIEATSPGQCTITGNLTLHGATKPVSFPATYRLENGGLVLKAKFSLDRSLFGMDQMLSGVDKLVEVEIVVGQKTSPSKALPGHGGDSKKKQSSVAPPVKLQHVAINLPNMT